MQMKSLHYGIFASITLSLLLFSTFSIAITDNIGLGKVRISGEILLG